MFTVNALAPRAVYRAMAHVPAQDLDFYPFGPPQEPIPAAERSALSNASNMGVVSLARDGTFLSRRELTMRERADLWTDHVIVHYPA